MFAPFFMEEDELGFRTIEWDFVRKKPFVKIFEIKIHLPLEFFGGVIDVKQVGVISKMVDMAMLNSFM